MYLIVNWCCFYHVCTLRVIYSRPVALVANFTCWLQPTFNKIYIVIRNAKFAPVTRFMCHPSLKLTFKRSSPDSWYFRICIIHNSDVIMDTIASQITSLTIVYSTVYSTTDQIKHQSPASLVFLWGIHRGPVNSPYKWPVTRKMFLFDDVIMI